MAGAGDLLQPKPKPLTADVRTLRFKEERPAALGLTIAFNLSAYSVYAASAPDRTQPPAHHHKTDFGKANAVAPADRLQTPAEHVPETDGLGRNDEDCNFGCIDH